jgi:hypothetical protein
VPHRNERIGAASLGYKLKSLTTIAYPPLLFMFLTPHPIETLRARVKSVKIAILRMQRPLAWEPTKIRTLPERPVPRC